MMNTSFKKTAAFIVLVLLAASVWGGFGSAGESLLKKSTANESISGMYFLHGTKISTIYPCTFTCFDMEPARDTVSVAFTTNVWLVQEKTDTLRFLGLLGADAGESGPNQFNEFIFPIELQDEDQYRIYGRISDNSEFEIDLKSAGPRYTAAGSFTGKTIQLEGQYHYRQRTFEYSFQGVRIEEE
ncbi:hypothetical protein [Rhodohalobacter sp. 614A]|uniref:hypothetical protein n=1 Tax=Rhodohalobacter sp. 614A TaxID=2908649 RepID=UPI001F1B97BB|nr:hypothetical protein [Rhodohalobacter sp. 614A]